MSLKTVPGVLFTPSPSKVPTPENYLGSADFNFLNEYMPETYSKIHDRFGTQDITGMLERMGKEMPYASDQIKWTEEGRLTELATGVTRTGNDFTSADHSFRVNETITVRNLDGSAVRKGLITAVTTNTFTALCGHSAGWTAIGTADIVLFADSNEFKKKTDGMQQSLNSKVEFFTQAGVITKELVEESGTNLTQMTWLEVEDSKGGVGYVWYFKNYKDTEKRFKNAVETKCIEGERWDGDLLAAGYEGTQGMFSAFAEGNDFAGEANTLADFDEITERLNAQGMIANNYIYGTSSQNLAIDDMLRDQNQGSAGWGMFDNDKQMAIELGFSGFRRGGYDFGYSRWRFLDNPTTQGSLIGASKTHAVMFPSGSKTVYDEIKGEAATQPMLHTRYRAKGNENRKFKMSVRDFSAGTSNGNDSLKVDFITERALVVLGRNNTMIFRG